MGNPAQIAAELEALFATAESTPPPNPIRDAAFSTLRVKLMMHLPTIIAALKAMEEQADGK